MRATYLLMLIAGLIIPARVMGDFGVTDTGGYYTVDTGAGLVFKVKQTNGDITSIVYNGVEYQSTTKASHLISGLGSATVDAITYGNDYIKITIATSDSNTVVRNLTHYLIVMNGDNTIYMATYPTAEPSVGELRWITRLQSTKIPNGPGPSAVRGNTGAIESSDVFGMPDGTTRSKYYGRDRAIDLSYTGATGSSIGVWMVFDNRESSSGGPFFRDIQNQGGTDQEIYNYMNSGHQQTEPVRLNQLYGPYALVFTDGTPPTLPIDYSWIETAGLDLIGWVSASDRGNVTGTAQGVPAGFQAIVGFANSDAQYWATVSDWDGTYTTPPMKPGTYTATLYKGELAVATDVVTVSPGVTSYLDLFSGESTPPAIFQIGQWDGTPAGFLNSDLITLMHPSDIRMNFWGPATFTVGYDPDSNFPMAQWRSVNNPTTIWFYLTPDQISDHTLQVGITCAFAGGRPQVTVNSWRSSIPSPSSQPNSRSLTVGTYRGNNALYTYSIPASAFVKGWNEMQLTVVSGSSGSGFLSPGYAYDAIELDY